jgi:ribosomal protein S18 acetylase RimI-like enzyme
VTIRRATEADQAILRELWEEFCAEVPEPVGEGETWEEEWVDTAADIRDGVVLLAEDEEGVVGYLRLGATVRGQAEVNTLYVRPHARRLGVTKRLLAEAVQVARAAGAGHLTLDVVTTNSVARLVYERLGFVEIQKKLAVPVESLSARVTETGSGETFGSVHVQTDDSAAVERAVHQFLPRLGHSAGTIVSEPRNGWVAVYDELCSREPAQLRRLARELADRMGAVVLAIGIEDGAVVRFILFDRGSVADEYASVPEFHGPLPPGDVVALRANPTVAARLTGADPARVREAAPTASSPADLPPPRDLLAGIAAALRVEGAEHGYPPN